MVFEQIKLIFSIRVTHITPYGIKIVLNMYILTNKINIFLNYLPYSALTQLFVLDSNSHSLVAHECGKIRSIFNFGTF